MTKQVSDHAISVIKAGLSAVPVVGGAIASLIGDYVPKATDRSIGMAIEELIQRIGSLESRIDPRSVDREEFSELFKSCYLVIIRTHQQRKRSAAVRLIANILLRDGDSDKLTYTELDHFVHCLDTLSIGAVEALAHAVEIVRQNNSADLEENSVSFNFQDIQAEMPEVAPDLLMGLLGELNGENLLHLPGAPGIRTADYANYPVELTPIGGKFALRFLSPNRASSSK